MSKSFIIRKRTLIGEKISGIRILKGLTQKDLAERMGVSKQAVSKLELSEKVASERLLQVAEALNVTIEILQNFNGEGVLSAIQNQAPNTAFYMDDNYKKNIQFSKQIIELFEGEIEKAQRKVSNDLIELISKVLKVTPEKIIIEFDEKTLFSSAVSKADETNFQINAEELEMINPWDKVFELYERLLASEKHKLEIVKYFDSQVEISYNFKKKISHIHFNLSN